MAAPRLEVPGARAAFLCISAVLLIEALPVVVQRMERVLGPPRVHEVLAVTSDEFRADLSEANRAERRPDLRRLGLPESWLEPGGRRRAPASLHVFVDGTAIPFQYREPQEWPPDRGPTIAYYVSPRLATLVVRCGPALPCKQALVVRDGARLRIRLFSQRLLNHPAWSFVLAGAAMLCVALAAVGARVWSLRGPTTAAFGALVLVLWYGSGVDSHPNATVWLSAQAVVLLAPFLVRGSRMAAATVWRTADSAESTARARLARLTLLTAAALVAALPHLWLSRAWAPSDLDDSFLYLFASSRLLETGSLIDGLGRREAWVYSGYPVLIAATARFTGTHPMTVYLLASGAGAILLPLALGMLAWSLSGRVTTGMAASWIAGLWGGLAGYAWLLTEAVPALLAGRAPPMMETDYYEPRFFGEYAGPHSEITAYLCDPPFYPRDVGLVLFWLTLALLIGRARPRWRLLAIAVLGLATVVVYPYYGASVFIVVAALGATVAEAVALRRKWLARAAHAGALVLAMIGLLALADRFVSNYLEPAGLLAYLERLSSGAVAPPPSQAVDFRLSRVLSGHFFMLGVVGLLMSVKLDRLALAPVLRGLARPLLAIGLAAACLSGVAAALDPRAWRMLSVYRWVVPWRTLVEPFLVVLAALALEWMVGRLWRARRRALAVLLVVLPVLSPLHWTMNTWRFWHSGARGASVEDRRAWYDEFTAYGERVLGRVRFREPLLLEGVPVVAGDYTQAAFGVTTVSNRTRALVPEGSPRLAHLLAPDAEPALRAASARGEIGDVMAVAGGELASRLRSLPSWREVARFGRFVVLRPAGVAAPRP